MGILRHGLLQVCYAKAPKMFRIHLNVLGGRYMSGYGVYASGLGGVTGLGVTPSSLQVRRSRIFMELSASGLIRNPKP